MRPSIGLATAFIGYWVLSTAALAAATTIVQNRDEPGRNPYQDHVVFPSDCGNYDCVVVFPKNRTSGQLVIENVTCSITSPGAYQPFHVFLAGKAGNVAKVYTRAYLPFEYLATNGGVNYYVINAPVLFYFDKGDRPTIDIYRSGGPPAPPQGDCALSGYRVRP